MSNLRSFQLQNTDRNTRRNSEAIDTSQNFLQFPNFIRYLALLDFLSKQIYMNIVLLLLLSLLLAYMRIYLFLKVAV
jgi:hypothetical protein